MIETDSSPDLQVAEESVVLIIRTRGKEQSRQSGGMANSLVILVVIVVTFSSTVSMAIPPHCLSSYQGAGTPVPISRVW